MQAYKLCDVNYRLKNKMVRSITGRGTLWISPHSLLINSHGSWIHIPKSKIREVVLERKMLKIRVKYHVSLEVNSKNDYIINALYHYIEGMAWQKT